MRAAIFILLSLSTVAAHDSAQPDRPSPPRQPQSVAQDLKRLTIEELAELDVTTVSRRVERLSQTAAAVSVVRNEDIRRMGVTSVAEAVRLADGIDVARSDGRTWNITARGFNIVTANKLLVLMDGRTLYSPLFSGTFWDVQDTILADIDRIEVVRGPGGTIWGANAVNGVINIMTKDASETRGNTALLATGTDNQVIASARHGGRFRNDGNYRIYGKYRQFGANLFANGDAAQDPLRLGQLGVRLDSSQQSAARWSLQANIYRGTEGLFDRDDTDVNGAFVMGRWSRRLSPDAEFQVRTYYDRTYRRVPLQFEEERHTAELDAQHRFAAGSRHNIILGGELRVTTARDQGSAGFFFEPERRTNGVGGAFVQDEITLSPDRWYLTVGSKVEANDYTGLEVQPTARVRWRHGERQTIWGAVSRAVRLPTRIDTDLRLVNPATGAVTLSGNSEFLAESVIAYEAGYRVRPHARVSIDVAAFANRYDNLRSQEAPATGAVVLLGNTLNAVTSGFEAAGTLQILARWRVHGSYAYLHKAFSTDPGSRDISGGRSEGNDPPCFVKLRSYLDLPYGLAVDGFFRHVAARPSPKVPRYSSLDLRLGWTVRPGWELSLIGHNLLQASHPEFGAPQPRRYQFQRGVYARSAWYF